MDTTTSSGNGSSGQPRPAREPGQAPGQAGPTRIELNTVAPAVARPREPEVQLDAGRRAQAKASIAANDRNGPDKREVIERMTPAEVRLYLTAGANQAQADQVLRGAAAREERDSAHAPSRAAIPPLEERFNVKRSLLTKAYEFRDQPGKIAFTERFGTLRSEAHTPAAVTAMMDRAGERGWSTVRISGSAEFMRQAWIAASARNIRAVGYEPTHGDIDAAAKEQQRLSREAASRIRETPARTALGKQAPNDKDKDKGKDNDKDSGRELAALVVAAATTTAATQASRRPDDAQIVRGIEQRGDLHDQHLQVSARTGSAQSIAAALTPATTHHWAEVDARDFRKLNDWPRQEDAAVRISETMRSNPEYKAALQEAAPEVAARVKSIDAAHTARLDLKDERKRGEFASMQQGPAEPGSRDARDARGAVSGGAAFMRAVEQAMDKQVVPDDRRPLFRAEATRFLERLHSQGKTALVRILDVKAPRMQPQVVPHYERQRQTNERAR